MRGEQRRAAGQVQDDVAAACRAIPPRPPVIGRAGGGGGRGVAIHHRPRRRRASRWRSVPGPAGRGIPRRCGGVTGSVPVSSTVRSSRSARRAPRRWPPRSARAPGSRPRSAAAPAACPAAAPRRRPAAPAIFGPASAPSRDQPACSRTLTKLSGEAAPAAAASSVNSGASWVQATVTGRPVATAARKRSSWPRHSCSAVRNSVPGPGSRGRGRGHRGACCPRNCRPGQFVPTSVRSSRQWSGFARRVYRAYMPRPAALRGTAMPTRTRELPDLPSIFAAAPAARGRRCAGPRRRPGAGAWRRHARLGRRLCAGRGGGGAGARAAAGRRPAGAARRGQCAGGCAGGARPARGGGDRCAGPPRWW